MKKLLFYFDNSDCGCPNEHWSLINKDGNLYLEINDEVEEIARCYAEHLIHTYTFSDYIPSEWQEFLDTSIRSAA